MQVRARATTTAVVVLATVLACSLGAGRDARAAGSEADGRKHARKANHLADINKCKAAILEYDKALRSLKDATLFFNRGECYRKTAQPAKAIADYKQFLVELPAAPNRAQVEAQIAALSAALDKVATAPAPAVRPAAAPSAPVGVAPTPSLRLPPKAVRPLPSTADKLADMPAARTKEEQRQAELDLYGPDLVEPVPTGPAKPAPTVAPAPVADLPQSGLLDHGTMARPVPADSDSKSGHAWLWVMLGLVVVGGAAGGYLILSQGKTDTSGGALGNYKF
jgi:hypothetical protein